jgi:glutamine---fructose-6-phosphate transaminase (isomerizing)
LEQNLEPYAKQAEQAEQAKQNKQITCCIAHTRWATHGGKTFSNAHPHISMNGTFALVHNGIIDNYLQLKRFLIKQGYLFKSATDSEVIVNLIEYYYLEAQDKDSTAAINHACEQLGGTFALVIYNLHEENTLYIIRNGSPIVIGENDNKLIISSEISGFNGEIDHYIKPTNNKLIKITQDGICSEPSDSFDKIKITADIYTDIYTDNDNTHAHWTLKEIIEQKQSLHNVISNGGRFHQENAISYIKLGGLDSYISTNIAKHIKHIILVGCGTSYYACQIAKHYFREFKIFDSIEICDGAELSDSHLQSPLDGKGDITAMVMCSQSGETRDVHQCLKYAEKYACITVGIVNVVDSIIANETDCGIYLNAGRERAVASTKSFTSMLVSLALLAMWFYQTKTRERIVDDFDEKTLLRQNYIRSLWLLMGQVAKLTDAFNADSGGGTYSGIVELLNVQNIFVLGNGRMEYLAREICLKMKELCYIHAEGYNTHSLKHGPFALLTEGFVVMLIIDRDNIKSSVGVYQEIIARGATCVILTNSTDLQSFQDIDEKFIINCEYNEHFQEILYIITMQYIIYLLSLYRNINPDKPRNLAKVVTV